MTRKTLEPDLIGSEQVAALEPQDPMSSLPQSIAGHRLLDRVGQGSLTAVYRARRADGSIVAIKILRPDAARDRVRLVRFYQGAKLAMRVNHPGVVQTLEVGCDQGWHFVVMEYVQGGNLAVYVQKVCKLYEHKALEIVIRLADTLQAVHQARIIHRDVNPANILLTRSGQVMLADLGLSKSSEQDYDLTVLGHGLGTPQYMAPEQFRGAKDVGCQADIYGLGATLYTLVTGKLPFSGRTVVEQLTAKIKNQYTPPEQISPALTAETVSLIHSAMHAHPGMRPRTAAAFAQLARQCLRDLEAEAARIDGAGLSNGGPQRWHILFFSTTGRQVRIAASQREVAELIRSGRLPSDARASLGGKGPFVPVAQIDVFRSGAIGLTPASGEHRSGPVTAGVRPTWTARLAGHWQQAVRRMRESTASAGSPCGLMRSLVVRSLSAGIGFGAVFFVLYRIFGAGG
ncbi:MAG: serine/threonine protein kinase [Pirellulales bacterium]|nr:serine/threonine protein kinase [Pirellulales bacterium]